MPINNLPNELLVQIMRFLDPDRWSWKPRSLRSSCLVCRRWLQLAQPLLFENVSLQRYGELVRFHSSLATSKRLGRHVRDLRMELGFRTGSYDPGILSRLMADCLDKTTELEKTSLYLISGVLTPTMAELVLHGICQLQKLEYLAIDGFDTHTERNLSFRVLLDLPKTIKTFRIRRPTDDLVQLLPKICANLSIPQLTSTATNTKQAGLSVHAQNQAHHVTGLRSLDIVRSGLPIISPALGLALGSTLTSFTYDNNWPGDESALIGFLAKIPLLEDLVLKPLQVSAVLFAGLLPLTQLRSLKFDFMLARVQGDGGDFCQALAQFLSQSPHFHTVTAHMQEVDRIFVSQFIEALLASTSPNGSLSRLRKLELHSMSAPSIDTIEHMCRSATMLQNIQVRLPSAPMVTISRLASALANLQQLVRASICPEDLWHGNYVTFKRFNGEEAIDFYSKFTELGWHFDCKILNLSLNLA